MHYFIWMNLEKSCPSQYRNIFRGTTGGGVAKKMPWNNYPNSQDLYLRTGISTLSKNMAPYSLLAGRRWLSTNVSSRTISLLLGVETSAVPGYAFTAIGVKMAVCKCKPQDHIPVCDSGTLRRSWILVIYPYLLLLVLKWLSTNVNPRTYCGLWWWKHTVPLGPRTISLFQYFA